MLGLGATIITNKRRIAADDFFKGMFETALEPDEIITKVSFPLAKKAAYQKFKHPASGFALVGVFVSKRGADIRVAVTGAGVERRVPRARRFEEALKKRFSPKSIEGMTIPADGMNTRHPRQRRISRASGRRAGAPGAGGGVAVAAARDLSACVRAYRTASCPALCRASTSLAMHGSKTWMAGTSPAMTE